MSTTPSTVSLTPEELKMFYKHIVDNNRYIQKKGKVPVTIEVVGESGIGKTSSIIQLAEELGLHFVKLNLAQIEEIGDLVGFPIRQFEMAHPDQKEKAWVNENMIDEHLGLGFVSTGKSQMGYCAPEWIANKSEGGILLLDDWNRADVRFIQAVMELIDRQTYVSWKLPKDWHIVLTSNPDNGEYNVNSTDPAQKTRFI
jgi:MoxR-like ATPase